MRRMVVAVAWLLLVTPRAASADVITYEFVQTSASLPGLVFDASITIDGTFADLPTINCLTNLFSLLPPPGCHADLTPLLDLEVKIPGSGSAFWLTEFELRVPPPECFTGTISCPAFQYPSWSLSPAALMYLSIFTTWGISFDAIATIAYGADFGTCAGSYFDTNCTATGVWQASTAGAPEPPTVVLFAAFLTALAWRRAYQRRLRAQPVRSREHAP